jgi:sacsin
MQHCGARYLKELHPKYSRSAFKSRGQRQSLVSAIRRILSDYSDTQAVLLEMLQNADDAKATTFRVILDQREFPTDVEGLLGEKMARYQGPALMIFNNSQFSEADFDALMEIGCGHKINDQLAVGRFGVGFNSVYHVTDIPSIVSGDHVVFLDPTAQYLSSASPDAPGLMIDVIPNPRARARG